MPIDPEILISQLRDWQLEAAKDTVNFIIEFQGRPKARILMSAPTGSGKSYPQLVAHLMLRNAGYNSFLLTPSLVIIRGLLEKAQISLKGGKQAIHSRAFEHGITTPLLLRNKIMRGEVGAPFGLIIDETHEFVEGNTVPDFFMSVCPLTPLVGFTATPYRGTIRGTAKLKDTWPHRKELVTIPEAIENGWCQFPKIKVEPLVDDDKVKIQDGKFKITSLDGLTFDRANDLADLTSEFQDTSRFDKPTVLALPSQKMVEEFSALFYQRGIKAYPITSKTKENIRKKYIEESAQAKGVLLQIKVLERGFDEPRFRRLIDAKPTLSPVALVQLWGRVWRPHEIPNEVIVTNRNLERHYYLFQGQVPKDKVGDSVEGFGGPSNRFILRHAGLENLGRFKALKAPMATGGELPFFHLKKWEQDEEAGTAGLVHFMLIIHPWTQEVICGRRTGSGHKYTEWKRCGIPSDFKGFQINDKREDLHPKLIKWWRGRARRYGLDRYKDEEIPNRVFQILPFLTQMQISLRKSDHVN